MGAAPSKSKFGTPQSEQASKRSRAPRTLRTSIQQPSGSAAPLDAERVHTKWKDVLSPRRRHRLASNADDFSSPILSTPGASGDREGGAVAKSSSSQTNVQHISGNQAPELSSKAAAIAAATMAAAAAEAEEDLISDLPDRPEENRLTGAAAVAQKRRAARLAAAQQNEKETESNGNAGSSFGLSKSWLIDRDSITLGKTIGHSSFGTVCEGRLNGTKVAVKTIKRGSGGTGDDDATIAKESEFNCRLRHPNIVLFMGIALTPSEVCIVTELMARGNVRDLLVPTPGGRTVKLDLSLRLQWAIDTAQGMAYLHSLTPPMIHRDLKTTNLLVDRGMNVKICDFGMSRIQADDKIMTAVGTVQFAAPEVLKHERYNEKVDIFSFGTVMWELYTRAPVFDKLPQLAVYQAVIGGNMPDVDDNCPQIFKNVMQSCWLRNPKDRPSFQAILETLSQLVDETDE